MARIPTERQYHKLLVFGDGCILVSGLHGRVLPALARNGWLAPQDPAKPDNGLRITPDGLRALGAAVERYGLPGEPSKRQIGATPPVRTEG